MSSGEESDFEAEPIAKHDALASLKRLVDTRIKTQRRSHNEKVQQHKSAVSALRGAPKAEPEEIARAPPAPEHVHVKRTQRFDLVDLPRLRQSRGRAVPKDVLAWKQKVFSRTGRRGILRGEMMAKRMSKKPLESTRLFLAMK
ncbi:MAG: hypothetical protein SGCHY_004377 [Lobulomycetales sp.]